jgi:hypothetical protein
LIRAVIEMKKRNPKWGCPQIADQIDLAFAASINKDVVRRILAAHRLPDLDYSAEMQRNAEIMQPIDSQFQARWMDTGPHPGGIHVH